MEEIARQSEDEALPVFQKYKNKAKRDKKEILFYEIMAIEASLHLTHRNTEKVFILTDSLENQTINEKAKAKGFVLKGGALHQIGNAEEALISYQKALPIFQKLKNKEGISSVNKFMGNIAYFSVDYKKAIKYYHNSINALDEISQDNADIYNNISRAYFSLNMHDSATYYNNKFKEKAFEYNSPYLKFMFYLNNSETASKNQNQREALQNLDEALKMGKMLDNASMLIYVYQMKALSYSYLGDLKMAEKEHLKVLEMMKEAGLTNEYQRTQKGLINIYKRQGKYKEALEPLKNWRVTTKITNWNRKQF